MSSSWAASVGGLVLLDQVVDLVDDVLVFIVPERSIFERVFCAFQGAVAGAARHHVVYQFDDIVIGVAVGLAVGVDGHSGGGVVVDEVVHGCFLSLCCLI